MNIIEWNIGYGAAPEKIIAEFEKYISKSFIFVILEVIPRAYECFSHFFESIANIEYSLEYRKPGKYDGNNRKLGVMIVTSKDIEIKDAGVFNRTLYPDRTLYETIEVKGKTLKIVAFHSITGCSHLVSKSANFCSLAEAVDEFGPDIVAFDANEPAIDHYEIKNMKFYEKNGKGAKVFFETLENIGLKDSFCIHYDVDTYETGKPIAVSHMINGKKPVRYDFIFVSDEIPVNNIFYDYDTAKKASADHAIVMLESNF